MRLPMPAAGTIPHIIYSAFARFAGSEILNELFTWGLRPRLYAFARFAGFCASTIPSFVNFRDATDRALSREVFPAQQPDEPQCVSRALVDDPPARCARSQRRAVASPQSRPPCRAPRESQRPAERTHPAQPIRPTLSRRHTLLLQTVGPTGSNPYAPSRLS